MSLGPVMAEVPVTSLDPREQKLVENARVALQRGNHDYVEEATGAVLALHPGCLEVRRLRHAARRQVAGDKNRLLGQALGSLTQAGFLFGKKDAATRLNQADRILARDPRHPSGLRLLAEAAAEADMPETAVFAWEVLREVSPQDRDTRLGLGRAYMTAGRTDAALAEADELLKQRPQDADALALMRQASVAQTMARGNWEKEGSFREKLHDEARAVSLEQAAKQVTAEDMIRRLLAEAQARLEAEPDNLNHHRTVIEAWRKLGDLPTAVAAVRSARATPAGAADATLARQADELQVAEIEARLQRLQREANEAPADESRATALAAAHAEHLGLRRAQLQAYLERYPNDPAARLELANLLLEAGEHEGAIAQFQQAQRGPKVRLAALAGMGHALLARRMYDLALDQFQAVKAELGEMEEQKKEIVYALASCLEAMGRTEEAMEELKLIYRVDVGFRDVAARINAHYAARG
jgi:tetratricopeptide (TPR) repeat protein